ncbi:MAG TPA: cupin-like domain-containing protein [Burkholderiaceae bacterium]|mgnify:CR=1 FL=1|nr:cupin-like domain-containing protein [Burkholderiaceae bacterium]
MHIEPVQRVDTIASAEFIAQYKDSQTPLIISQLSKAWPACEKWSFDYLSQTFGDNIVPLYGCEEAKGHRHQHAHIAEMRFGDYIQELKKGNNTLRMFFYNILQQAPALLKDFSYPNIGLKLFKKLPVLFFGGKGTKVQLHFDIDWADLLLCHFGGQKRVYLFAYDQSKYMYHVPFSFSGLSDIDIEKPDYQRFPALQNARGSLAVLQHGDVLYIPPGYWHYIIYDDASFSMTLRALPRKLSHIWQMVYNIICVRTADGLMRRWVGQPWNERNRQRALERSNAFAKI